MKILASIIITALMATSQGLSAKHYKLFILTGQSNSLGVTNGGENDPSPLVDPADQHVLFAWHNRANKDRSLGHSGQIFDPARETADFTTMRDQQGGYYPGSATHWGPEIGFSRTLYRAGVRDFGVIKVSRGGGGNGNWMSKDGHMYKRLINTVEEAVASIPKEDTYEFVGLLYLQGESDNEAESNVAGARFKQLVDNLRKGKAKGGIDNAGKMHAVIGGITVGGATRDVVRAKHAEIAAETSYIDYFDNTDLVDKLHDKIHYNKEAKLSVGARYAQHFLASGIVDRHYGKLVFIGDSITQGGNGDHASYRYQIFKNLSEQGVSNDPEKGYQFVGSLTGGYANSKLTTPDVDGVKFINVHEGHYGWRASWINGRVSLPANRRGNNRGEGTLLNWTGQAKPQVYAISGPDDHKVKFPDRNFKGSGVKRPYKAYIPDTAVIMIGINDISDGTTAERVSEDIGLMVDQLQSANPKVNIFLCQTLYTNQNINGVVDQLNKLMPQLANSKSTNTSSVWVIETNNGFDPKVLTYDKVHPNQAGEKHVGDRISAAMGIISIALETEK